MKNHFYAVKCITNLHMGSGDTNFSIIDNEVQKDQITNYPIMHSSGVKGALRDYFKSLDKDSPHIGGIFGSDRLQSQKNNREKTRPGMLKFISAQMLCMPVRSADSNMAYYLATSIELLKGFGDMYFAITGKEPVQGFRNSIHALKEDRAYYRLRTGIKVEDKEYATDSYGANSPIISLIKKFYPDEYDSSKLLILPHSCLSGIQLPIIARNQLDNGISKNLWFEEVVPHGSVFFLGVLSDGTVSGDNELEFFHNQVKGKLIQFGGNASVGYGLTQIIAIS